MFKKIIFTTALLFSLSSWAKDAHQGEEHKAHADKSHSSTTHHAVSNVSPDQALTFLKNGHKRFMSQKLRKDGQGPSEIAKLSSGQQPHTIVLSCSDSRVPPEVVFDQKLGEIFVVRTAGETIEPTSIASIEYAIEHLGTKLILVMGHSQCGAVKAALSTADGQDAGSPNLNKLVADIHPRLKDFERKPASTNYVAEGWANTSGVAKDLLKRSKIISDKVAAGDVQIKTALYHIETGKVDFK